MRPIQESPGGPGVALALCALAFCVLGLLFSYYGYLWGFVSPNPGEVLGAIFFWSAAAYLVLAFTLRSVTHRLLSYLKRPFGAASFLGYLSVHLVLYGFLLETIFSIIYGASYLAVSPGLLVTTDTFAPPSISSALFDLAYNPTIVAAVPPVFSVALSFYSIVMAVTIAVLVTVNVGRTKELGELCTRWRRTGSYTILPTLGVILGASCCLSVAGLLGLATPSAYFLTSSIWVYYVTFFAFPVFAACLLWLNLRSIERIAASVVSSSGGVSLKTMSDAPRLGRVSSSLLEQEARRRENLGGPPLRTVLGVPHSA